MRQNCRTHGGSLQQRYYQRKLCSYSWAIRQVFGVAVCFKATLRVMAWVAGKVRGGQRWWSPGSGVRSLHAGTRCSRRAGVICSSCRNGPWASLVLRGPPMALVRLWSGLTDAWVPFPVKYNAICQPFKCLETSSLGVIGVISVVLYSLPFSLRMCILCADFFILQ